MQLFDLVHDSGFRTGIVAGAVAVGVVVVLAVVSRWHPRRADPLPLAGVGATVAALVALGNTRGGVSPNGRLVVGVALLALGPLAVRTLRFRAAVVLATLPGAALVAWAVSMNTEFAWMTAVAFVAVVCGAALVSDFDRANAHAGLGPVLLALAALSAYTALPDTEQVAALAGAALPIALLGTPIAVAALGAPGAASTVGLFVWIAAIGGRARPGSFVGAIACLGVMLVEPIVRRALPPRRYRRPPQPLSPRTILVIALDVALVVGTSRIAGLETSALEAGALAAALLAAAAVALAVILAPWGDRSSAGSSSAGIRARRTRSRPAADSMRR